MLASIVLVNLSGQREKARIAAGMRLDSSLRHALGAYAVGIWRFDDCGNDGNIPTNLRDASGYNNHGINNDAVCRENTPYHIIGEGTGRRALEFDGENAQVAINNEYFFDELTVSSWIYIDSFKNQYGGIVYKADSFRYYVTSNHLATRVIFDDGTSITANAPQILKENRWHYVVMTYDGNYLSAYVDGVEKRTSVSSGGKKIKNNTNLVYIGTIGGTNRFHGKINNVHIYEKSLTLSQIESLYYAGLDRLLAKGLITEQEHKERL